MSQKNIIRLTEADLQNMIRESVKNILLHESFNINSDMVKFYLNSPMNGRLPITVPFNEFVQAKYKNDYLWEKAAQQHDIVLMRNGYFEVDPNDPHADEINRIF